MEATISFRDVRVGFEEGDIVRDLSFEVVAIGGSGLLLLGLSNRPTRDLDLAALVWQGSYVKADPLPPDLAEAARPNHSP